MLLVVVATVVVGGAWWVMPRDSGGSETRPRIETVAVDRGDIERTVAASGAVRPLITVEVGSQLSGQIAEIHADFNSTVERGQVIAVIDPQTFESRVLQATADLQVAESNIVVQRANIDRAQANLRRAELEYDRAQPLRERGTLSASEFDGALAAFESAKADLTMAEAQLRNAMATREQRAASLESAEIDLGRTQIRSPIDGVVIERAVDQGQTVAASLSSPVLFRIAQDLTAIQIEANVDEADIGNVHAGNAVAFTVDAYPDAEFAGTVEQVRLAPNELNNVVTYTVIITAANPGRRLLPGMTAIVEIVTGRTEDVLRVVNDAVRFEPPEGSELIVAVPAVAGAGPGGLRRRGFDVGQFAERLGLTDAQVEAIQADTRSLFQSMRGQFGGGRGAGGPGAGGDPDAMRERMTAVRERMRGEVAAIMRTHLSDDQFETYERLARQAAEVRQGRVWIRDEDGSIRPVDVRLGISDDSHTQLITQALDEGEQAVTRIRR